jgi:integrase
MDHMNHIESHLHAALQPANILTLRDVIAHIKDGQHLAADRKGQLLSGIRTLCRVLGSDPVDVPANPPALRARIENVSYAAVGLTQGRWANIRSLAVAGLNECGFGIMPGKRKDAALSAAWENLWTLLPGDRRLSCGLSRFMTYCSANQIAPGSVSTKTFVAFNHALETNSLVRNISTVYRTASACWNEAGQTIAGWPANNVDIPNNSRQYSFEWDKFPASFKKDVDAFLDKVANPDPFADDYAKPLSPITIKGRRKQIRLFGTALAASGFPVSEITRLAVLVKPKNAESILRFFMDRSGGGFSEALYNHAVLLRTIALKWVKGPTPDKGLSEEIERLNELCKRLAIKNHGMTAKNRSRLRQFDEPDNIAALLDLPYRLLRETEKADDGGSHAAMRVMYAVAINTLIYSAIRIKNLTALELERNLARQRIGSNSVVHLVIPGEDVKNGEPVERELPKQYLELLDIYLKKYRPRLISGPSTYLFPNANGSPRNAVSFGRQIGKIILTETGITMHVHLFRHMTVKFHLEAHPEDIETARRLLGHKSLRTTMRSYADMQTAAAFTRYDTVLAGLGEQSRLKAPNLGKAVRS